MTYVDLTRHIGMRVVLLASILTGQSQMIRAEKTPLELTFYFTRGGEKGFVAIPRLGYHARYSYRGADDLDVIGENQIVRYGKLREGFALPIAGAIFRVSKADRGQAVLTLFAPQRSGKPRLISRRHARATHSHSSAKRIE